jgi:hypothetical protein
MECVGFECASDLKDKLNNLSVGILQEFCLTGKVFKSLLFGSTCL